MSAFLLVIMITRCVFAIAVTRFMARPCRACGVARWTTAVQLTASLKNIGKMLSTPGQTISQLCN